MIEDWGTGYWPSFPDGRAPDGTPHVAGMVGFVKELVDECAAADITDADRGTPPRRESRIERMQVGFGQVFVVKPR